MSKNNCDFFKLFLAGGIFLQGVFKLLSSLVCYFSPLGCSTNVEIKLDVLIQPGRYNVLSRVYIQTKSVLFCRNH